MLNAETQRLVQELRNQWDTLSSPEKGNRLTALVKLGCSDRGLADELELSPTTVRRQREISNLPKVHRDAIEEGKSAKGILERQKAEIRRKQAQQRVAEDRTSGVHSDRLATEILTLFHLKRKPHRETNRSSQFPQFISDVKGILSEYERSYTGGPIKSPGEIGADLSRSDRATWAAKTIWSQCPERSIWETALNKALSRRNELEPKRKGLSELWVEMGLGKLEPTKLLLKPILKSATSTNLQSKPGQPPLPDPRRTAAEDSIVRTILRGADKMERQGGAEPRIPAPARATMETKTGPKIVWTRFPRPVPVKR